MPNEAYPRKGLERDWGRLAGNRGRKKEGRVFTNTVTPNAAGVYKRP